MAIYEITVPPNTIYADRDFDGTIIDLEPLTNKMYVSYHSVSKNRECSIEVDLRSKELITDAGKSPPEFPTLIKAIRKQIRAGTYNQFERKWGTTNYNKIVKFLDHVQDILPEEELEEEISSHFNFNPDSVLSLKGNLNDANNEYNATCKPIALVDKKIIKIEKELYLFFKNGKITAEHYYYYENEEIYSGSMRNILNDDGYQLYCILKNYQDKVEESLLETIVLCN